MSTTSPTAAKMAASTSPQPYIPFSPSSQYGAASTTTPQPPSATTTSPQLQSTTTTPGLGNVEKANESVQPEATSTDRNIVVLGAGFSGMSISHYFMRHIYPALKDKDKDAPYKLHIFDQSTHFWWRVAAPRAIATTKLMPHNKTFFPLEDGFKQYAQDRDIITFYQAQPVSVDTDRRIVSFEYMNQGSSPDSNTSLQPTSIPYYALIIATGTRTPTPITSFHGDHKKSQEALDDINKRLARAQSVIIAGGGPIAVETAGEVGEALNGANSGLKNAKVEVTVIAGGSKLLPVLGEKYSKKAAKLLEKVGVNVVYNTKVSKVDFDANEADKTTVTLDNNETMSADVYIPATGAIPNTGYLPNNLLNERGYVNSDSGTLRVNEAGERVYVVGDVGAYTRGGILDLYAAAAVLGNNLAVDLGVRTGDKQHKSDTSETQLVPVGSKGGVAAFKGFGMPGFAVKQIKGKDYMIGHNRKATWGEQFKKP